jgi:hypothetical protein
MSNLLFTDMFLSQVPVFSNIQSLTVQTEFLEQAVTKLMKMCLLRNILSRQDIVYESLCMCVFVRACERAHTHLSFHSRIISAVSSVFRSNTHSQRMIGQ